jgi:hypothetical protein
MAAPATDTATQVIVGASVNNVGSDRGELTPMVEQIAERHEVTPAEVIADGGFVKLEDIESVSAEPHGCTVGAWGRREPNARAPADNAPRCG